MGELRVKVVSRKDRGEECDILLGNVDMTSNLSRDISISHLGKT